MVRCSLNEETQLNKHGLVSKQLISCLAASLVFVSPPSQVPICMFHLVRYLFACSIILLDPLVPYHYQIQTQKPRDHNEDSFRIMFVAA
jgi:hypothetical protein